jgi:hypothetical protein
VADYRKILVKLFSILAAGVIQVLVSNNMGTGGAFSPVTHTYNGTSGNETVPTGASSLTIEAWGGGGQGGLITGASTGRGGAGGGYCKTIVTISAGDYGASLAYVSAAALSTRTVSAAGTNGTTSTVTLSGLIAAPSNLSAGGGNGGAAATSGPSTGGVATGGNNTNTNGSNNSTVSGGAGAGPGGGAGGTACGDGTSLGGGGAGGNTDSCGQSGGGGQGQVKFTWT